MVAERELMVLFLPQHMLHCIIIIINFWKETAGSGDG